MYGFVDPNGHICLLFEAQHGLCFHCHKPMVFFRDDGDGAKHMATREHVYPRANGGDHYSNNIVLAHGDCNERRGCPHPTDDEIARTIKLYRGFGMTAFADANGIVDRKEDRHRGKIFTAARNRMLAGVGVWKQIVPTP
jgi:hypothetical protein